MLIFFHGPETFRPKQKVETLIERYLQKNPSGAGLLRFDLADEDTLEAVADALPAGSLFTERRLLIVKNPLSLPAVKQRFLANLLERLDPRTVAVFWEVSKARRNSVLFRTLCEKADKVQEFDKLEGSRLRQWTIRRLHEIDSQVRFRSDALDLLLLRVGDDLNRLNNELEKLAALKKFRESKESKIIVPADIDSLVANRVESDIFGVLEAVFSADKPRALSIVHRELSAGTDCFKLLSMLVYQVRTLLTVGDCFWSGQSNRNEISRRTGLSPFVVGKALRLLPTLSRQRLLRAHHLLAAADRAVKTGRRDIETIIDLLTVKI